MFHLECRQFNPPESRYICEELDSGRMPLLMFWPVIAIPPPAVLNVDEQTDIYLRFIGMHAFGWINWRRIYLYHEGDLDSVTDLKRSGNMERYNEAVRVARQIFERLQAEKSHAQESASDDLSFKLPMTYNYNFETFGDQKKICWCGAGKCSELIVSQGTENWSE
ncbi:hypothetical protein pipiens_020005 [Culex pipiens pipiens]|uniref:Post-SET domain-containing protein n=1 Tax=Culex pipiens pipiens TaxID=38569 RepID=A0ABD1DPP2_CULPP